MDFDLSEEQRSLRDSVVAFARRELADDVLRRDAEEVFSPEAWRKCADFGIQGLPIPKEYGGTETDALSIMVALEALGYACRDNGLLFSLNAHMWSCEIPILTFGSAEQKRRWLPGLCNGSLIGVQGMTEPGSGSDAFGMSTTARRDGERWILNGSKTFITNAPVADLFVVFAVTDRGRAFGQFSAFLVERTAPGLTVGRPMAKMGLRTSPMAELSFEDCVVPAENLLGSRGAGMAIFNSSMEWERSCILASAVGTMQRHLEQAIGHGKQRTQFGQPIGKFQAVSHRIVDMKVRLDTARLLLYQLGWLKAQGRPVRLESSLVKLWVSECWVHSSLDVLQLHGGYGYMTESQIEREVRDSLASRIYSGTSDIQRNLAARLLLGL
jgi:hypothetical protein